MLYYVHVCLFFLQQQQQRAQCIFPVGSGEGEVYAVHATTSDEVEKWEVVSDGPPAQDRYH